MKFIQLSKAIIIAVSVSLLVGFLSFVATGFLWPDKKESAAVTEIVISDEMTISQFGSANNLDDKLLTQIFKSDNEFDPQKSIKDSGMSNSSVVERTKQIIAIESEHASKNWVKIAAKFAGWGLFLGFVFVIIRKRMMPPLLRKFLLVISFVLFGVILGSDPSPMGTVKDTIVLLGRSHIVFPPRLIALAIMIIFGVILVNRHICSWGCQFGTLQDFIFRIGRNRDDSSGSIRQFKIPFIISNSIRIVFFISAAMIVFISGMDIIGAIDPFKIFNPRVLTAAGIIFISAVLLLSLFTYRPWCHLLCPFGLIGWIAEKLSIYKIKVNYTSCIACEKCAKACPSSVMGAILKQDRIIPDCYMCGVCIGVCPTKSISLDSGKRMVPPKGKFQLKQ